MSDHCTFSAKMSMYVDWFETWVTKELPTMLLWLWSWRPTYFILWFLWYTWYTVMSSHDEKLIIDAIHFVNLCMSNRKLMLQKQKGPPQFMYFRFLSVQLLHPFTFPLCVWISYCNLPYFLYTDSRAINWFNFIWFFDWRTIIFIAGQCNTTEKWQLWQLVFCKVKGKEWCWRADHGTQELQLRYD